MSDNFTSDDQPELFLVEGQLSEVDVLYLTEEVGPGPRRGVDGDITVPFRATNHFSIGTPIVLPLAQLLTECGETVPADIRLQMQHHEFYQVHLACSFQAAPGCRFHDARFALALHTLPDDSTTTALTGQGDAIAYDLFPRQLEDKRTVNIKHTFNPEVKFGYDPLSVSLSLPLYEHVEQYVAYTSRIVAFDLQGTQPAWTFTRTEPHEISGPQKLFMIVRKPKGTQVKATFNLTATVQFVIGGQVLDPCSLVMIFRRRNFPKDITDEPTYPLC